MSKANPEIVILFRWFQGFHWQGLIDRTIQPPYKPKVGKLSYLNGHGQVKSISLFVPFP